MRVAVAMSVTMLLGGACRIDRLGSADGDGGVRGDATASDARPARDGAPLDAPGADAPAPPDGPAFDAPISDTGTPDTGPFDAGSTYDIEWGGPMRLDDTIDMRRCETDPVVTSDGRWLFLTRPEARDTNCYVNRRFHVFDWNDGAPVHRMILPRFDMTMDETNPHAVAGERVGRPGQVLFYHQVQDGMGQLDIRFVPLTGDPPTVPADTPMGVPLNTPRAETGPSLTPDGQRMIFNRDNEFVEAVLPPFLDWTELTTHVRLSSATNQGDPAISADGLVLVFMRRDPGGSDDADLWMTRRRSVDLQFDDPVRLAAPINSGEAEMDSFLTAEGDLLFVSARGDGITRRVYLARRLR